MKDEVDNWEEKENTDEVETMSSKYLRRRKITRRRIR
jgi:hypothetical protein